MKKKNKYSIKPRFYAIATVLIFSLIFCINYIRANYKEINNTVATMSNAAQISEENVNTNNQENEDSKYSNIYYYNSLNEERYINYQNKRTDLSKEDVVWMVNQNLDTEFYKNIDTIKDITSKSMLVNKYNKLPSDYVPNNLKQLDSGVYLAQDAKEAFEEMQKDAKQKGYYIKALSGYRSIADQEHLYNNYVANNSVEEADTYSARPGCSEHNTGLALDIGGSEGSILDFENTKECKWIAENAYKYGFIIRYKEGFEDITGYMYEPWHLRYVGTDISTDIHDKSINTLEEYYEKYIIHSVDNGKL